MAARIAGPKLRSGDPNRWDECEKAIKPRFNMINWVDMRDDKTIQLLNDAMAAGWTEREVIRAIWALRMLRDTASVTRT
jgi:hypothetical protein